MEKMTIRDMHRVEKPREKLLRYGVTKLSNVELLALVLGSGTKKTDVMTLASKITHYYSGKTLRDVSVNELLQISGIGSAKACALVASQELFQRLHNTQEEKIISAYDVWNRFPDVRDQKKEFLIALFINARGQVITQENISIGTVDTSLIHPREVFEPAIRHAASTIILVHNHPSGNTTPSDADIAVTMQLINAGKLLGIAITDHVIISKEGYFSFLQNSLL